MKRLNIFVDETGEFGFGRGSAKLYGVSLVFHEQKDDIKPELRTLKQRLSELGFNKMVHMGDLVMGHGDFEGMTIAERKKIYRYLYYFSLHIKAKYYTIIIDKRNISKNSVLSKLIYEELMKKIDDCYKYFNKFDEIVVYYDGGQVELTKVIVRAFSVFGGYRRKSSFDHVEKKLFQVADMLTYLDKIIYKYDNNIKLTKTEVSFFNVKDTKIIIKELLHHRL